MTTFTNKSLRNIALTSGLLFAATFSLPTLAEGGSVHHSGQASKHSVLAVTEGSKDSLKVASAVVATPIIVAGGLSLAAGSTSVALGDSIANGSKNASSHTHNHGPLEVTEIIITADPAPNQVVPSTEQATTKAMTETHTTTVTTEVSKTKTQSQ